MLFHVVFFSDDSRSNEQDLYGLIGTSSNSSGLVLALDPQSGRLGLVCSSRQFGHHEGDAICRGLGFARALPDDDVGVYADTHGLSAVVGAVSCRAGQEWKRCQKEFGEQEGCYDYARVACTSAHNYY